MRVFPALAGSSLNIIFYLRSIPKKTNLDVPWLLRHANVRQQLQCGRGVTTVSNAASPILRSNHGHLNTDTASWTVILPITASLPSARAHWALLEKHYLSTDAFPFVTVNWYGVGDSRLIAQNRSNLLCKIPFRMRPQTEKERVLPIQMFSGARVSSSSHLSSLNESKHLQRFS